MTVIGYARTRASEDTAAIRAELTAAGCTAIYCDERIPVRAEQPQLDHALTALPAGGTLVVCRLIHIGRSLEHLAELLICLDHRGIRLRALHEQLDTVEHGELFRQITQGLIDARNVWRSESTREGLAAAVAAGRKIGRQPGPPLLTQEQDELARQLRDNGVPLAEVAELISVSRAKLYRAWPTAAAPTTGEDSAP
ncbi:DNA invertase Pin-like site-specific DNA recombinase [Krasilnikovia cinnamomea]|uniref:DNA invertase Pin-like site-specific DNA recombinase n=1 Tax=Krasilnikovia cinnamomea TaxID=349313 RepID=A0A4V2G6I4_9ACTN|nr:recombinase family protein [Krasilnikovia cinnamomea]RZU48836.1 DNA invertase Pin-like site-specific DNA recombinase [Krasilnikovia cinnamomea]